MATPMTEVSLSSFSLLLKGEEFMPSGSHKDRPTGLIARSLPDGDKFRPVAGEKPLFLPSEPVQAGKPLPRGLVNVVATPFQDGTPLAEHNRHLVAGFTCAAPGQPETDWEREVSRWITDAGDTGAWQAVRLGVSDVRLFCSGERRLIGYAAIGPDTWTLGDGEIIDLWMIQYVGVHTDFRYQQGVASNARPGRRIFRGMIEEVNERGG